MKTKRYTYKCIWHTCRTFVRKIYIFVQYILDSYVVTSYYTSYLTKIDKILTQKMKIILNQCKIEQIEAFECIEKLGNAFLNAHQISIQQVVHITLSISLYHSTISFQFRNTCQQQDKAFVLSPQKKKVYL
jgi:hypothetical protein